MIKVPVLVKIAPDLEIKELEIAEVARKMSINGIIVSNTTTERPINSQNHFKDEEDCQEILFSVVACSFSALPSYKGQTTLIGVGGVESAEDVLKIRSGASGRFILR